MTTDRATMLKRAAQMRREPTEAERRLWRALSRSQLDGHKFRRQVIIGSRIADFFCPAKGLIVEVDGDTHDAVTDSQKDESLRCDTGFVTLRFSNFDVRDNMGGVLETLSTTLNNLPDRWVAGTTPNPSSEEEGLS
jgi:very-short-patch-repair endonuclease